MVERYGKSTKMYGPFLKSILDMQNVSFYEKAILVRNICDKQNVSFCEKALLVQAPYGLV